MNSFPPPGWYPVNNNPQDIRWWDGNQWSLDTSFEGSPSNSRIERLNTLVLFHWLFPLIGVFIAPIIGSFLTPRSFTEGATGFLGILIAGAFGAFMICVTSTTITIISYRSLKRNIDLSQNSSYRQLKVFTVIASVIIPIVVVWNIFILFYCCVVECPDPCGQG